MQVFLNITLYIFLYDLHGCHGNEINCIKSIKSILINNIDI